MKSPIDPSVGLDARKGCCGFAADVGRPGVVRGRERNTGRKGRPRAPAGRIGHAIIDDDVRYAVCVAASLPRLPLPESPRQLMAVARARPHPLFGSFLRLLVCGVPALRNSLRAAFVVALLAVPFPAPAQDSDTVTLNFVNADIDAVVKAVAEITGRNFVLDPKVKGTINIVSARPVPKSLVYPTFLSALRLQGFTAVEGDGIVKIVPE